MKMCPVYAIDCPYYIGETGGCELENPMMDCDDYYAIVGDEED